jgi:uncharacterized paraquat-inducible protein A
VCQDSCSIECNDCGAIICSDCIRPDFGNGCPRCTDQHERQEMGENDSHVLLVCAEVIALFMLLSKRMRDHARSAE